jgi:hypothetical protein
MVPMPPDLSRLGDELTAATSRAVAERRRRRRRLARALTSAAAGLLSLIVLAPAALTPDGQRASLLDATDTMLVRLPEHPPVLSVRPALDLVHPPNRPPLPSLTVRRDA